MLGSSDLAVSLAITCQQTNPWVLAECHLWLGIYDHRLWYIMAGTVAEKLQQRGEPGSCQAALAPGSLTTTNMVIPTVSQAGSATNDGFSSCVFVAPSTRIYTWHPKYTWGSWPPNHWKTSSSITDPNHVGRTHLYQNVVMNGCEWYTFIKGKTAWCWKKKLIPLCSIWRYHGSNVVCDCCSWLAIMQP